MQEKQNIKCIHDLAIRPIITGYLQICFSKLVIVASSSFINDLSDSNHFAIIITHWHANQGMCTVASLSINFFIEPFILWLKEEINRSFIILQIKKCIIQSNIIIIKVILSTSYASLRLIVSFVLATCPHIPTP